MPNYWILKTEPSTYSFDQLIQDTVTTWDGVGNPVALKNIKSMAIGDEVLVYHTGDEKSVVGLAKVVSAPRADPANPKLTVIDLKAGPRLDRPVSLAEIKADPAFAELALVRQGRLSVVPVPSSLWATLLRMASSPEIPNKDRSS